MVDTVNTADVTDIYQVDVSLPSQDLVYGLINHDNPPGEGEQILTPELMVLGTPQANQTAFDRNTQIAATATARLTELEDYQGTAILAYDRINIGTYLRNVSPISIDMPEATTMRELWPTIKEMFGLGIDVTEIVDDTLNWDTVNGQLLKIAPGSLAWTGSVRILMKARVPNLNDIVARKQCDGLRFQGIGTQTSGEVYSYGRDTSNVVDFLEMLVTGTTISDITVADMLSEITGDKWQMDQAPLPYNVFNAWVTFNGQLGGNIPKRAGFTHGIEIAIDSNYCLAVGGPLVFYYNLPDAANRASLLGTTPADQTNRAED